jgi:hypothetical protein
MTELIQLQGLEGQKIAEFYLHLQTKPKRRVGHFDISLFLKKKDGAVSELPIITGLFSRGNRKQKVFPWLDIHYLDRADFSKGKHLKLSQNKGLSEGLFQKIGALIPSGGMIFLSYLTDSVWGFESPLHESTRRAVSVSSFKIPAVALPLGRLLFFAGCHNIKSGVYDVQGSGRLAGEKASSPYYKGIFLNRLVVELEEYLSHKPPESFTPIEEMCRSNATEILESAKGLF